MSVTASDARARLFPLIEQVNEDQEAVEIISKKGTAYLVSEAEYRSWRETMHLLASPENAERLRASVEQYRAGAAAEHALEGEDGPDPVIVAR